MNEHYVVGVIGNSREIPRSQNRKIQAKGERNDWSLRVYVLIIFMYNSFSFSVLIFDVFRLAILYLKCKDFNSFIKYRMVIFCQRWFKSACCISLAFSASLYFYKVKNKLFKQNVLVTSLYFTRIKETTIANNRIALTAALPKKT